MTIFWPAWIVAAAACGIAVITDVRARRIPNALTLPLLAVGPIFAAHSGWWPCAAAVLLSLAVLFGGTMLHAAGLIGGGDIKLIAAVCCLIGFSGGLQLLLFTALSGGALAVIYAACTGKLRDVLARTFFGLHALALTGSAKLASSNARIPYAVAIALGLAIDFASLTRFPQLRFMP